MQLDRAPDLLIQARRARHTANGHDLKAFELVVICKFEDKSLLFIDNVLVCGRNFGKLSGIATVRSSGMSS